MPSRSARLNSVEKRYEDYLDEVRGQLSEAQLHIHIGDRLGNQWAKLRVGHTFFRSTRDAHYKAALLHLCNILDRGPKAVGIHKILNYAQTHIDPLFTREAYERRQATHPAKDLAIEQFNPITNEEIKRDHGRIDELADTVRTMRAWRNEVYAHRGKRAVAKGDEALKLRTVQPSEVEKVIDTAFDMLNRYSLAFLFVSYQQRPTGENDVEDVLSLVMEHQS